MTDAEAVKLLRDALERLCEAFDRTLLEHRPPDERDYVARLFAFRRLFETQPPLPLPIDSCGLPGYANNGQQQHSQWPQQMQNFELRPNTPSGD